MNSFAFLVLSLVALSSAATMPGWQGRMVGSSPASVGQFPHAVSLRTNAGAHFCGGWVHTSRWIISVAGCTFGRTTANSVAVVGAHALSGDGTTHELAAIHNHPDYNINTKTNDIAALQTVNEIVMNERVQPIPLGAVEIGIVDAVTAGWGLTSFPGSSAETLRFVNTRTMINSECQSQLASGNAIMVTDNKICAFAGVGVGICNGDAGNAMIAAGTVIGAASWGVGCAQGSPDVYSRVSSHRSWISSVTGSD